MAEQDDDEDFVRERMWVTRRKDSHYTNSQKRPGEFSPLTRNEDDELRQVTLSHLDEDDEPPTVIHLEMTYIQDASPPDRTGEQRAREEFAQTVVRALLELAIEYGTPHARRFWIKKLRPAIQARAQRGRERRKLRRQRRAKKKSGVVEASIVETPSQDIATVADEFRTNMASSEAQARFLMAMAARRFADEQMRVLADADIRAEEGMQELEHALSQLRPEQVAKMLEKFELEPLLLTGDALTGLGMIFGVQRPDEPLALEQRRERED